MTMMLPQKEKAPFSCGDFLEDNDCEEARLWRTRRASAALLFDVPVHEINGDVLAVVNQHYVEGRQGTEKFVEVAATIADERCVVGARLDESYLAHVGSHTEMAQTQVADAAAELYPDREFAVNISAAFLAVSSSVAIVDGK